LGEIDIDALLDEDIEDAPESEYQFEDKPAAHKDKD
jgi:hypothetical protein